MQRGVQEETGMLDVRVEETRNDLTVKRTVHIGCAGEPTRAVSFEFNGSPLPSPIELYDFAVLTALFSAMRHRMILRVHGPVSERLLTNLEEFQEAWALWRPDRYAVVPIIADEERHATAKSAGTGIFAFSGGVDGSFALLRHHLGRAGRRRRQPIAAVLIHGFDIALSENAAFETACKRATGILSTLGVPLVTIRTNWRDVICAHWELEFGSGIAACLHQFSGIAGTGVFGADEDYAHLQFPWGSNPVTNHLLSGGDFDLWTEGGGFTRTERVGLICERPDIATQLRVCWQGRVAGSNCGRCEKCIRTKMNFLAQRIEPLCFDDPLTVRQVLGVKAHNPVQIAYLQEILEAARRNEIHDLWVKALSLTIRKNRVMLPIRPAEKRLRGWARSVLSRRPHAGRFARAARRQP
jgi:hypothetical protein